MSKVDQYISNKVWELRNKKGFTQQQLADLLGFKSRISIARIEAASQVVPASVLFKMCEVFRVTPNKFFPTVKH